MRTDVDWLAIVLLTYNRFEYAEATLRATLSGLIYDGPVGVHIADDGSPGDYAERLQTIAGGYAQVKRTGRTSSLRGGYGRNFNLATQAVHSYARFVLPLEDDWALVQPLDANAYTSVLADEVGIGCIRLGYLGYTDALRGRVLNHGATGKSFLLLDADSPEKHVFTGHPRIETVAWERMVGPWPEALSPGATELAVCSIRAARRGVAWPIGVEPSSLYQHIGTLRSYE